MNRALSVLLVATILCSTSGCHWFFQHPWFAHPLAGQPYGGYAGGCHHDPFTACASCLGCGEVYWGDWPTHCDPCDQCGNWVGWHYNAPPVQSWYDLGGQTGHGPACGCDDCAVVSDGGYHGPVAEHMVPYASAPRSLRAPQRTASQWYDYRRSGPRPTTSRAHPPSPGALAGRQPPGRNPMGRSHGPMTARRIPKRRPASTMFASAVEFARNGRRATAPSRSRAVAPSELRRASWYRSSSASGGVGTRAVVPALYETSGTAHRLPAVGATSKAHCAVCRREAMLLGAGGAP